MTVAQAVRDHERSPEVEPFRVYWMPGCSSCVKLKEFMKKQNIDYISRNMVEDSSALDELDAMGAKGAPVLARGKEFCYGQTLSAVVDFLGKDIKFDVLPAASLMERMFYFNDINQALTACIPQDKIHHQPIPNRDRAFLSLAYHVFQVQEAFLETVEKGSADLMKYFDSPPPPHMQTPTDIVNYGEAVKRRIWDWWGRQADTQLGWTVDTFYGEQPLTDFLERSVWHAAQHARQVEAVLDGLAIPVPRRIDKEKYVGLPMPDGLWT